MSRQDDIKSLLVNHHRRLQRLKERKAVYGLETPVAILTEIEDIEAEIEALQTELTNFVASDDVQKTLFPKWSSTRLWSFIKTKEDLESLTLQAFLQQYMSDIELFCNNRENSEFILYDPNHPYRLAERIVEVIPQEVLNSLSVYELVFLLLASYLHDIGLTPALEKVQAHYIYLLIGDIKGLTNAEINQFQIFLGDYGHGIEPPLSKDNPTASDLRTAKKLTTHYCRTHHTNWGEKWIYENFSNTQLGQYKDWLDDLVALCSSHQYSYQELKSDRFNPRILDDNGQIVHLRYLAVALRIVDILEFTPERTPDIIFRLKKTKSDNFVDWLFLLN